jgi:hypothetical protein
VGYKWVEKGVFIKFLVGGLSGEIIIAAGEFKYLYFEVWVGCEGWFMYRWGS